MTHQHDTQAPKLGACLFNVIGYADSMGKGTGSCDMRGALSVTGGNMPIITPPALVDIGWTITFADACGGHHRIRIVSGDTQQGNLVGTRSPLGVRLAKRPLTAGDQVSYPTPTGQRTLTVVRVYPTTT